MQILYHANIYTLEAHRPKTQAIAIHGDKVIETGSDYDLLAKYSSPSYNEEIGLRDMGGLTILPGLTDAHIHLLQYSLNLQNVDCETSTKEECLQRVAERAARATPGEWIVGHGWNQNNWEDGFGTVADLDRAAPGNPVYLTAKSLHAAWASSKALQIAHIGAETGDPEGGNIQRNQANQPTGILFESAMQMVAACLPKLDLPQMTAAIRNAIPILWQMGLTGLHDFDGPECFSALQILHREGSLGIRVVKSLPRENLSNAIALGIRSGFGDKTLRIGNVKCFADGALGPRTAAMLQPYAGEPENRGLLFIDEEELFEIGREAISHGLGLAVHAIGDRANHEILNGYARLAEHFPENSHQIRNRIEHVQLIHKQDASRLGELGIIASMQPVHATSDMLMADRYWGKRSSHAYAWKHQLEARATLAFGSDAPVESPNPFWGLHAAVTRRRLDGSPGPQGWYPEQRIELLQAIEAYTLGPAFTTGRERELGALTPGFLADLIVLPQDPFTCPPDELHDLSPLATMIGGKWVFSTLE